MSNIKKISIIGGGSFGTALGILLANKGNSINIYNIDRDVVNDININRKNDKYIKDLNIPNNVKAFSELDENIINVDYILLAVPSNIIRMVCNNISKNIKKNTIIISIAKGMEVESGLRLSEVISQEIPNNPVVILSGPSHAEEVALNIPTTVVATSTDMEYAKLVQDLFMTKNFRVYTNDDIVGVEVGGAVKNVIALAAGISDGIGYGDNSKAALMSRGMAEIVRIGVKLGGKRETFLGLTGMGDLIVTCGSIHSRNRKAGYLIGKGVSVDEAIKEVGMVVEGIKAAEAFYKLKEKLNVDMPIIDVVYRILFEGLDKHDGVDELLSRDKKHEINF